MKVLCKGDPKFIFFIIFFYNPLIQSQQLALPIQTIAAVGSHQISVNDFVTRYSDYISLAGIKDNIVTSRSILNNMIGGILHYYYEDNKKNFNDPEYQRELKWAGKQTVLAYMKDQEIFGKLKVTDQEIRGAYYKLNEKISSCT